MLLNSIVLLDSEHEELTKFKWFVNSSGYATRFVFAAGRCAGVHMHSLVCPAPFGFVTDHINKNKLDNRSSNLRILSNKENSWNRKKNANNSSGVTGVYWNKKSKKWLAYICIDGVKKYVGGYDDIQDAAKAVGLARAAHQGVGIFA